MDLTKLKKLIEMVEASDIDELELTEDDSSIRIRRRGSPSAAAPPYQVITAPAPASGPAPGSGTFAEPAPQGAPAPAVDETDASGNHVIASPMVGTFYRAPAPGSPSFAEVGQRVNSGDTLGLVEAMKILNQIESDVAGTVASVLVENGSPIEFGEPLFLITVDS